MPSNTSHQRSAVTAVIVSHDGARLLPGLVQAMRAQTHPVDRVVGVDTSSRDRSGALLAELLGGDAVFGMEAGTGYGTAVARALRHAGDPPDWIWLLHDDCEPAPDALEQMLRVAGRNDATAILGPKLRDLADRRVLRETGLSVDRAGRRLTGIEPGEIDQGQHDGTRSVLAVSSAGMLVRRDAWERLGGFEPSLPLFRDDIDLCWRAHAAGYEVRVVTDAVVYHRELSARQIRKVPAAAGQPRRLDRRAALYVLAVNLPFLPMLLTLAGCVTGSLLRALWFLLTKQRRRAFDQLTAVAWLARHPLKLWRARRRRAPGRKRAYAVLKAQIPSGKTLMRLAEGLVGMLSRSSRYEWTGEHGGGMTDAPDDELPLPPPDSWLRRVFTHPAVLLFLVLLAVTCVAERSLLGSVLSGSATLGGGALVPAWGGAADLWHEYLAGFHSVGAGSTASAPPYLAVLGVLATVFGGKPWLAVDVVLLGCVPIAGMAAYLTSRRVTKALGVRLWLAAGYAMLPIAAGTVAAGRIGTAMVFMLLPVIAVTIGRMLRPDGQAGGFTSPRARRAAWAAGLLVAIAAAFVPLIWVMALAAAAGSLLLAVAWYWRARPTSLRRWPGTALVVNTLIVAAVPALVLLPWTAHLFAQPSSLLLEAGLASPGLATANLRPEPVLLLSPGGPGLPPVWVTGGLIAAALCALLLRRRPALVRSGWAVALAGLITAAVVSRFQVISPVSGGAVPAWPGAAMAVAAGGLLIAATPVLEWAVGVAWGVAASEARLMTRARLVGRRGAAALLLGALAVATPVASAGAWLAHGVRGPVAAAKAQVLPAFIAANSSGLTRTLVLRRPGGILTYELLRGRDPVLGEPELPQDPAASAALGTVVATLAAPASGDAEDAGQALSSFGIGWVLLPAPVDPALAAQLDSQAGLQSLASSPAYVVWRVANPIGAARVVTADGTVTQLPAGTAGSTAVVPAGASGTLVVPEPAGGWTATVNGRALTPLSRPVDGWAAGFVLPAGGGPLVISRDNLARTIVLSVEVLAVLAAFVLALPGVRGAAEPEAAEATETAETEVQVGPGAGAGAETEARAETEAGAGAEVAAARPDLSGVADDTAVLERVSATTASEPSANGRTPAPAWEPVSDPWEDTGSWRLPSAAGEASASEPTWENEATITWDRPAEPAWREPAEPAWGEPAEPAWGEPAVPAWGEPAAHDWEPPADPWEPVPVPVRDPALPEANPVRDAVPAQDYAPARDAVPVRDAVPSAPRKGGSHRAAKHSKPSRGFPLRRRNGDTSDAPSSRQATQRSRREDPTGAGSGAGAGAGTGTEPDRAVEQGPGDLSLATPDLFKGPASDVTAPFAPSGSSAPSVPTAALPEQDPASPPWASAERPSEASNAPWDLGGAL